MYLIIILSIIFLLSVITFVRYKRDINQAYERLDSYKVESIDTEYGKVSFIDSGKGEAVLISHGIFGGYDQALVTLNNVLGEKYRKIAPSRFGYPGSDMPANPDPGSQAGVFVEILDKLGIEKTFVLTTSAGGAPGIRLAVDYPERVKGLILLSSGVPDTRKSREEISGLTGPPAPIVNDFPMWFTFKHFGFVMNMMFGSEVPDNMYETMLPVRPRRAGILNDGETTNIDMLINYDDYPVEKLNMPILLVHAKDDPLAKFDDVKNFISRVKPQTAIFETGGHVITGHDNQVSDAINGFIKKLSCEEE